MGRALARPIAVSYSYRRGKGKIPESGENCGLTVAALR
jgi:hypothetical protein